jgi:hypothetical protein
MRVLVVLDTFEVSPCLPCFLVSDLFFLVELFDERGLSPERDAPGMRTCSGSRAAGCSKRADFSDEIRELPWAFVFLCFAALVTFTAPGAVALVEWCFFFLECFGERCARGGLGGLSRSGAGMFLTSTFVVLLVDNDYLSIGCVLKT